jgi:hypothetical protein
MALTVTGSPLLGALFLGAFSIVLLALGAATLRPTLALRRTPTSPAGLAQPGPVEVAGVVGSEGDLLRAPLSGMEVVAYEARIRQLRRRGRSLENVVVWEETRSAPFAVRDASGALRVEPDGAFLALRPSPRLPSAVGAVLPGAALGLQAIASSSQGSGGALTFEERVLAPGDPVVVVGHLHPDASDRGRSVGQGDGAFLVAAGTEAQARRNTLRGPMVLLAAGTLCALGAALFAIDAVAPGLLA